MADTKTKEPFLPVAIPVLGDKEVERVSEAVRTGWISYQGRFVGEFEESFARACGGSFGVAVSSGTTALHVALTALGVGPGDEVILPALCHISAVNMVTLTGATPILVDVSESTWGLDPNAVQAKLSPRSKVILPVHLYGHPVDMDPVMDIAAAHGLRVVCDAAEAHGAEYKGRPIGALGDYNCFSFYANKIITTGEGGMVVSGSSALAERARFFMDEALNPDNLFVYEELGYSYRMSNVQAAIGLGQIERLEEFVSTKRRNAKLYNELLGGTAGLTLPPEQTWAKNVYWMYSLLIDPSFGVARDELRRRLRAVGIDSRPFFQPVHKQPLYAERFKGESYPVAERLALTGINLPSGNGLSESEVRRVAAAVRGAAA